MTTAAPMNDRDETTMTTTTDLASPADQLEASGPMTRRRLLGFAAALAAGGALAACGSGDNAATDTTGATTATSGASSSTPTTGGSTASGDAAIAKLAAGLEVLAVGTYKAALEAAQANKLGMVPPAVATFATTAMGHHQQHLDAWNKVLTTAGAPAVTAPDAKLKPVVDQAFAGVKDVTGVARLALLLEETAAATYLSAQDKLQSKDAIKLAGSIQIVDAEHAAILHYVLGEYPVPDVFAKKDKAAS